MASSTNFATSSSMVDSVSSDAAVEPANMPGLSAGSQAVGDSESFEKPHCATMHRAMLRTCWRSFDAPAERDGELALEELEGVEARLGPRLVRREEREAAGAVRPRDDRELRDGVEAGDERRHDAVARLVVRDEALARGIVHARRLGQTDRQPVDGVVDLRKRNLVLGPARGHDGRLVHEVL